MPDKQRAAGEEGQRYQPGNRAADAARGAPYDDQSNETDYGAQQSARLEYGERQNLGGERGEEVEAAAIHVEIDEGERPLVGEAGRVKGDQEIAIFGVGVVVPAEAIVAKGGSRDQRRGRGQRDRDPIAN